MLDRKDQILLEYLMHNCRLSTTFLSKVTKLSQTAVVYRIKRLEEKGIISKYDAMVNWPMLPVTASLYFISVPKQKSAEFERRMTEHEGVSSLFHLLHKRNYAVVTFLWPDEQDEFNKHLKREGFAYELFSISREEFISFCIYDVPMNLPAPKISPLAKIEMDEIDVKIAKLLANGGGRDSILEISRKTGISYDIALYRFRKLMKKNFFMLFFAQPSPTIFGLQVDMLVIKTKSTSFNRAKEVFTLTRKNVYIMEAGPGVYFTQLFTKSFVEYKQTLDTILNELGDDLIEMTVYNTKNPVFINRTPFEKLLRKPRREVLHAAQKQRAIC